MKFQATILDRGLILPLRECTVSDYDIDRFRFMNKWINKSINGWMDR